MSKHIWVIAQIDQECKLAVWKGFYETLAEAKAEVRAEIANWDEDLKAKAVFEDSEYDGGTRLDGKIEMDGDVPIDIQICRVS